MRRNLSTSRYAATARKKARLKRQKKSIISTARILTARPQICKACAKLATRVKLLRNKARCAKAKRRTALDVKNAVQSVYAWRKREEKALSEEYQRRIEILQTQCPKHQYDSDGICWTCAKKQ